MVFSDSSELNGPPHVLLPMSDAVSIAVSGDEVVSVPLSFEFDWYGTPHSTVSVTRRGGLFFGALPVDSTTLAAIECAGEGLEYSGVLGGFGDWDLG